MTLRAILLRLSLLPLAGLYVILAGHVEPVVALGVAGLLLSCCAAMILRGLAEDMSPFETGGILVTHGALILAPLPFIASQVTPGLCTDASLMHEIALTAFQFLGVVLCAHLCSKGLLPGNLARLTRRERDWIERRHAGYLAVAALPLLAVGALMVDRGACVPGSEHLITPAILSLPLLGMAAFIASAARRRRPFLKGRQP